MMTKKITFTPENPEGVIENMTPEEITPAEAEVITGNNIKKFEMGIDTGAPPTNILKVNSKEKHRISKNFTNLSFRE